MQDIGAIQQLLPARCESKSTFSHLPVSSSPADWLLICKDGRFGEGQSQKCDYFILMLAHTLTLGWRCVLL